MRPRIVLLHGMLGVPRLLWWEYFHGVGAMLTEMGWDVLAPRLPWGQSIVRRARALAARMEGVPGPLHFIAHSMGGLDARYYITHLGGYEKTASLTTLATPHHGSAAADYELTLWYSPFRHLPAVADLTRKSMQIFNDNTPNRPEIIYRSYSAARPLREQPWLARRHGRVIDRMEGENDSQVSVASARWGEHLRTLRADHFELIGMNIRLNPFSRRRGFDHLALYREIVALIRQPVRSPAAVNP